jgi:hypothetical protein
MDDTSSVDSEATLPLPFEPTPAMEPSDSVGSEMDDDSSMDSEDSEDDSFVDDRDEEELTVDGKTAIEVWADIKLCFKILPATIKWNRDKEKGLQTLIGNVHLFEALDKKLQWFYDFQPEEGLAELHAVFKRYDENWTLEEYCEDYADLYNVLNHE